MSRTSKQQVGRCGEAIAAAYLKQKKYTVLQQNYTRPWGEIDIVAKKSSKYVLVEVKTVSYGTLQELQEAVLRGTRHPLELIHTHKQKQLHKIIETWWVEFNQPDLFTVLAISVRLVPNERYPSVCEVENLTLEAARFS